MIVISSVMRKVEIHHLNPVIKNTNPDPEIRDRNRIADYKNKSLKEATEAETRHWPDAAVRLVTVLSNSIHSRTTKMIQIEKSLAQLGFPDSKKLCTTVQKKFSELDNRLMEGYLETRRDPIVCALEPGMYAGYFDWATCARPNQVLG